MHGRGRDPKVTTTHRCRSSLGEWLSRRPSWQRMANARTFPRQRPRLEKVAENPSILQESQYLKGSQHPAKKRPPRRVSPASIRDVPGEACSAEGRLKEVCLSRVHPAYTHAGNHHRPAAKGFRLNCLGISSARRGVSSSLGPCPNDSPLERRRRPAQPRRPSPPSGKPKPNARTVVYKSIPPDVPAG